jgi:hypothetical protein
VTEPPNHLALALLSAVVGVPTYYTYCIVWGLIAVWFIDSDDPDLNEAPRWRAYAHTYGLGFLIYAAVITALAYSLLPPPTAAAVLPWFLGVPAGIVWPVEFACYLYLTVPHVK